MSKHSGKTRRRKTQGRKNEESYTSDRSRYIVFVMIGLAVTALGWLLAEPYWSAFALGYLVLLAYLINVHAYQAYRGRSMAQWQRSLARVPLRFAGYGTRHGKPLEAAHHARRAMTTVWVSVAVSVVILALLGWLWLPALLA